MAGQIFRGSAVVVAPIDAVWSRFDNSETWEGIAGVDRVYDAVHDAEQRLIGFKFDSTAVGKTYVGVARPGPRRQGDTLAWHIKTSEIEGRVVVTTGPVPNGTRVEVLLDVAPVSMMASLAFPLIAGAIAGGFQKTVDDFAAGLGR